jgi:hypothetical protein
MPVSIIIIILVATIVNVSSFFYTLLHTPQFTQYMGAVHYPADYYYYLAAIIQGRTHWLTSTTLSTSEQTGFDFHNWFFVLFGHIFSFLPPYITYQIMVVVGSIAFLFVSYKLFCHLFPAKPWMAQLGWVIFLISNSFPKIHNLNGTWEFSFYYPWNNYGQPLIRLTNVPHHLIIQTCLMAIILLTLIYWKQKQRDYRLLGILAIMGFSLASLQPVQWAVMSTVLGVAGLIAGIKEYIKHHTLYSLLPCLVVGVAGLAPALYLKQLVTRLPFSIGASWEASQQIFISPLHYIRLNGPVVIVALMALPLLFRKKSYDALILTTYAILSVGLSFTHIPEKLHILNIRVLSVIPTVFFVWLSTLIIIQLSKNNKSKSWLFAILILAITIPVTVRHIYERVTLIITPDNPQIYLPIGAKMAMDEARRISTDKDIFLAFSPYTTIFPALEGRHIYISDELTTIDFPKKREFANMFYQNRMSTEEKIQFLRTAGISYVFAYAWGPLSIPGIEEVYKNGYMILYKVTP